MEPYFWVASSSSDCNASSAAPSSPSASLDESSSSSSRVVDCALVLTTGGLEVGVWLLTLEATAVCEMNFREGVDLPSLSGFDATSSSSESATRLLLV